MTTTTARHWTLNKYNPPKIGSKLGKLGNVKLKVWKKAFCVDSLSSSKSNGRCKSFISQGGCTGCPLESLGEKRNGSTRKIKVTTCKTTVM
jgi:hypothetical protein